MATPQPPSESPSLDREAAIRAWEEQHAPTSLVTNRLGSKRSGICIAALGLIILGALWYWRPAATTATPAQRDFNIAERQPVPKLNPDSVGTTAPPPPKSADMASTPVHTLESSQQAQQEAQRREQAKRMLDARLKSALVPPNAGAAEQNRSPVEDPPSSTPGSASLVSSAAADHGAQDPNSRFAQSVSGNDISTSQATQVENLPYKILQGKLIEAVLEPRAVSDLPGLICAVVQRDVVGAQGREVLIPWGSRVCGVYNADLRKGQSRLFVVWNRLRRPDGVQVTLDSAGADQLGTAGMGGIVDSHFGQIFGTSALLSIIGAGTVTVGVSANDQYNSAAYYRQAVQQAAAQTSQQAMQPYLAIPPTVTVPAGSRVRIYVNRDLDFSAWYASKTKAAAADNVVFIP